MYDVYFIQRGSVGEMLLLDIEGNGHLLSRSLDRNSTELVSSTIERNNIGNLK